MASRKPNHVHKFRMKVYESGYTVYFCVVKDCPYRIEQCFTLGKEVICWRCNQPFELNEYSMRLVKPHCDKCIQRKKDGNDNSSTKTVVATMEDVDSQLLTKLLAAQGVRTKDDKPSKKDDPITQLRNKLLSTISASARQMVEPIEDEPGGDDDIL